MRRWRGRKRRRRIVAEGFWLYPKGETQGIYLDGGKKYNFYTKDKATVYYATNSDATYTVEDKNVRIVSGGTGLNFTLGVDKLVQEQGSITLTRITPTNKIPKGTDQECEDAIK